MSILKCKSSVPPSSRLVLDGLPRLLRQQRRHPCEGRFDDIQYLMFLQHIQQFAIQKRAVTSTDQPSKAFRQTRQTLPHELCAAIGRIRISPPMVKNARKFLDKNTDSVYNLILWVFIHISQNFCISGIFRGRNDTDCC